jgi:hypothetical protein
VSGNLFPSAAAVFLFNEERQAKLIEAQMGKYSSATPFNYLTSAVV